MENTWVMAAAKRVITWLNRVINVFAGFAIVRKPDASMKEKRPAYIAKHFDFVRISSLSFAAEQIYERGISGNVAELGVFQGEFAQYINQAFPDRTLYLFDTFEGFAEADKEHETKKHHVIKFNDFSKTSVETAMERMIHPENVVIRKGYFPSTAEGLEDTFCFVSIDVDLSEPIYQGLCYFYPRMQKGGYILVHDYNNSKFYAGTKKAVDQFAMENDVYVFPMSDFSGSVAIIKQ